MRFLLLLAALALAGCAPPAGGPTLGLTPRPAPTVPLVGEILAAPTPGPVKTVGYLYATAEGAALVEALRLSGDGAPAPLGDAGIWLGSTALPAGAPVTTVGATSLLIVEAAGRLEGPGRFGPDGRYRYSLVEPQLRARTPRELTIAVLLANSGLYEGQPVRLRGQLLTSRDTALLVESLGAGGVPDAGARQIKLGALPADPALSAGLTQAANGRVSYGGVELIGIWRTGTLYPLAVRPEPPGS